MAWLIAIHGMKQRKIWAKMALIPVWDALAFGIWLARFLRNTIRWRGVDYHVRKGLLMRPGQTSESASEDLSVV